jgi:hypothetical protein
VTGANVNLSYGAGPLVLGNVTASSLNVSNTGGAITEAPSASISVSSTTTLAASSGGTAADVTLSSANNNFGGALNATGAGVTLADGTGGLVLGNVTAASLNATSTGGAITETPNATLSVAGTTTLAASSGGAACFDRCRCNGAAAA